MRRIVTPLSLTSSCGFEPHPEHLVSLLVVVNNKVSRRAILACRLTTPSLIQYHPPLVASTPMVRLGLRNP